MGALIKKLSPEPQRQYAPNVGVIRPEDRRQTKYFTAAILAALMLFVVIMSFFVLSKQSLRLDESQSLWQSSRSPSGILYVISQDVHVPLYGLMLHYWQLFLGNNVSHARLFSLFFFLASIPMTYRLGKLAYNRNIGLLAAGLMAISPFLNWYGNEIRMYSLLTFFTLINQYYFIKLFKKGPNGEAIGKISQKKAWWGFFLSGLFGIYTHYFFWLILLTDGIFFLFYRKLFPPKTLRNLLFIAGALFLALLPWLYYVLQVNQISNASPILIKPSSIDFFNTFSQFIFGFQNDHINTVIVSLWPLSVLFAFLSLRKNSKIPPQTLFFFIATILPIVLAFLISVSYKPLFLTRYLIFTVPFLYLFFSWFLTTYPKRLGSALKMVLIIVMLLTLANQIRSTSTPVKEGYKDVAQYLSDKASAQDVVIISAPFTVYPIEYYYRGSASLTTLPIWDRFKSGAIPTFSESSLPGEVDQIKGSHQLAYVVLSYNQGYESQIKNYFDTHFQRVDAKSFTNDLNVYAYKLRYDEDIFNDLVHTISNEPASAP